MFNGKLLTIVCGVAVFLLSLVSVQLEDLSAAEGDSVIIIFSGESGGGGGEAGDFIQNQLVFQVNDPDNNEQAAVKSNQDKLDGQSEMPVAQGKEQPGAQFHPEWALWDDCAAISAAAPQPEITEYRHQVLGSQSVLAGIAMRGRVEY